MANPWPEAKWGRDIYLGSATLKDGRVFPCVIFVVKDTEDQHRLFPRHGFIRKYYRFDDSNMVDVNSVSSVAPSPYVIPNLDMISKLSEHGHFDDEIRHATLILNDGREYWHDAGFQYFVGVPQGYAARDIVGVKYPSAGYDSMSVRGNKIDPPAHMLCIFRRPSGVY